VELHALDLLGKPNQMGMKLLVKMINEQLERFKSFARSNHSASNMFLDSEYELLSSIVSRLIHDMKHSDDDDVGDESDDSMFDKYDEL